MSCQKASNSTTITSWMARTSAEPMHKFKNTEAGPFIYLDTDTNIIHRLRLHQEYRPLSYFRLQENTYPISVFASYLAASNAPFSTSKALELGAGSI